jgi:dTDP-4-dehydrorhamnose reductase
LRVLITGSSGLFGNKLAQIATKDHIVYSGYHNYIPNYGFPIQLNIINKKPVEKAIKNIKPDTIVHAASLTNVDMCETRKKLAWKINVEGTKKIVQEAKKHQCFLIYISTDYVFNGEKGNYSETDIPSPINYYGKCKLKAEEIVQILDNSCIARSSVIYGAKSTSGKTSFALWIINNLMQNQKIKMAVDQITSPTFNTNLAEMILEIAERRLVGIYHTSGSTAITRYDFAKKIANKFNLNEKLILPVSINDLSFVAKRPKNSSLNIKKSQEKLKNKPKKINHALERLKKEIKGV